MTQRYRTIVAVFSRRARFGWDTWGNESLHGGEVAV